jgi:predicted dehydrogenase
MVQDNIRLGVVGLSSDESWAGRAHVPALKAVPGYEIRALATSRQESAAAAAQRYGVPHFYSDPAELVARPDIDLVVIAVKVPHHLALVDLALNAGKAVYCEWPLGNGLSEAEEMAARAKTKGVRTFVGLQGHASPPLRYIRDLIASGHIGDVISSTVVGSAGAWGATVEPRLIYGLDKANGVSMLTVQFGHLIDGFCWCLGEFSELSATLATRYPLPKRTDNGETVKKTIADQIAVNGLLQNGAVASLHYRSGSSPAANFFWEINGSKGDLVITADSGRLQYSDLQIRLASAAGKLETIEVPDSYRLVTDAAPGNMHYTLANTYALLRSDLRNATAEVPDFGHGLLRHKMIDSIEKASESGQRQGYLAGD